MIVMCAIRVKSMTQAPTGLLPIWTDILLDFIEGLAISSGKSVILVVVDMLSKYAHFISILHPYSAVIGSGFL